jgi:hypothetical protein
MAMTYHIFLFFNCIFIKSIDNMTDKPKRYSLENPQTKEMWEKKIRVNLKDSYEGYKDFYTWYHFLQERYQAIYDDYLQLKDFPDDEIWLENIVDVPVLGEMVSLWYYDPIDSTKFYLSIVADMIEYAFYGPTLENRNIIKRVLKEETNNQNKLFNIVMNHILKNYGLNRNHNKVDFNTYKMWADSYVKDDIAGMFGITEENQPELYHNIMDEYIFKTTGLLKKGTKIRLIDMKDPYTKLKRGDIGVIVGYNPSPWGVQYMVKWENGSTLDIIPDEDEFEVLS